MTEEKKSLASSIKEALAKKHAAQHPDSRGGKSDNLSQRRGAAPVGSGKPMKKSAGRGR
jgi:hypothetical protein